MFPYKCTTQSLNASKPHLSVTKIVLRYSKEERPLQEGILST